MHILILTNCKNNGVGYNLLKEFYFTFEIKVAGICFVFIFEK